jgi:hypothetical protein
MTDSHWRWKWVVIAAHQAMYTFFILALSGTAPRLTVTAPERAAFAQMRSREGYSSAQIAEELTELKKKPISNRESARGLPTPSLQKSCVGRRWQ